ncbi:MAG: hypothetical protein RR205_04260 [Oscillospiraceae bacterium]
MAKKREEDTKGGKNKVSTNYDQDTKELDLDELGKVIGGANPFKDVARVKNHDYDRKVKDKI